MRVWVREIYRERDMAVERKM